MRGGLFFFLCKLPEHSVSAVTTSFQFQLAWMWMPLPWLCGFSFWTDVFSRISSKPQYWQPHCVYELKQKIIYLFLKPILKYSFACHLHLAFCWGILKGKLESWNVKFILGIFTFFTKLYFIIILDISTFLKCTIRKLLIRCLTWIS